MKTLAIVIPQGFDYADQIRQGVLLSLEKQGNWQLIDLPSRKSGAPPVRSGMTSLNGLIAWTDRRHEWLPELAASGVPVVNCGSDWAETKNVGIVAVAMMSVLDLAIDHFASLSLKRIAFFGHRVSQSPPRQGLVKAICGLAKQKGIATTSLETRGKSPDEDLARLLSPQKENVLRKTFEELETPIGIFCENDFFARLACNVALEAGLRIPTDIAILGSSDNVISRFGSPTISTIPFPGKEVGRAAFQLIDDVSKGKPMPGEKIEIPASELTLRESTGGKALDLGLERVHRFIEHEALQGITVQELPPIAGISLKSLRTRYGRAYGEEPGHHIRRLRIEEAKRLLSATSEPVASISALCGFSSQAGFYNYFQRHVGIAPVEYRNRESSK